MTTVRKIVEFFSTFTVVPIDPNDVADQLKSFGIKDQIEFVEVELDVRVIRGALHHYVNHPAPYAEPVMCADIYIDKHQAREWRRLVAIKELLHLLDHSVSKTATAADCEKLVGHLASIKNLTSSFDINAIQAWTDTLMLYHAVAVAFPEGVRDILYEDYKTGRISLEDIKIHLDIPIQVIEMVMSDGWPPLCKQITGRK